MKKNRPNGFFAMFFRQKYINRWGLMKNLFPDSLSSHAAEVSSIAHALAVIGNTYFGKNYNEERVALLGLYHDMPEVFTGDMPTPVKYANESMRKIYAEIEAQATEQLIIGLPVEMQDKYKDILCPSDKEHYALVKAADKLSAYIKCIDERKNGNLDFDDALNSTKKAIESIKSEEAEYFIKNFLPSFEMTVDELK